MLWRYECFKDVNFTVTPYCRHGFLQKRHNVFMLYTKCRALRDESEDVYDTKTTHCHHKKSFTAVRTAQRHSDLKLLLWRLFERNFPLIENPVKANFACRDSLNTRYKFATTSLFEPVSFWNYCRIIACENVGLPRYQQRVSVC